MEKRENEREWRRKMELKAQRFEERSGQKGAFKAVRERLAINLRQIGFIVLELLKNLKNLNLKKISTRKRQNE